MSDIGGDLGVVVGVILGASLTLFVEWFRHKLSLNRLLNEKKINAAQNIYGDLYKLETFLSDFDQNKDIESELKGRLESSKKFHELYENINKEKFLLGEIKELDRLLDYKKIDIDELQSNTKKARSLLIKQIGIKK